MIISAQVGNGSMQSRHLAVELTNTKFSEPDLQCKHVLVYLFLLGSEVRIAAEQTINLISQPVTFLLVIAI
jgi:hypothetical protein